MEYITVRAAAQKWNMTEQMVIELCIKGCVCNARKREGTWEVPAEAEDPRIDQVKADGMQAISDSRLMPLMNTAFKVGECLHWLRQMEDGIKKEIAFAEYHYFSGQPEKAIQEVEFHLACPDTPIRLSACLIYAYANLSIGKINQARHALYEVQNTVSSMECDDPKTQAMKAFVATAMSVLLHLPPPKNVPEIWEYLSLLPPGIGMFALYVQAHYTYLQGDYAKSLGIVETALALQSPVYPIPAIYLHLMAVMDLMSLKQRQKTKTHLLAAWALAQPDDLIEGFGEHHGLLGGMLEAVIKKDWPEDFKRIIAITYRFSAGWRKIHNKDTGHDVADNLTTTEFAIAMLAARGWTNAEIGSHMNISPNTVKRHISSALQKLGIDHRRELQKYMLR